MPLLFLNLILEQIVLWALTIPGFPIIPVDVIQLNNDWNQKEVVSALGLLQAIFQKPGDPVPSLGKGFRSEGKATLWPGSRYYPTR